MWIGGHLKEPIDNHMTRLELRRMAYVQRMALHVGRQVWQNAGSPDDIDKDRLGVVIGTGLGGGERIVETYDTMNEHGIRKVSPLAVQMCMPNGAAAVVGLRSAPARVSSRRCRRVPPAPRPSRMRGARS